VAVGRAHTMTHGHAIRQLWGVRLPMPYRLIGRKPRISTASPLVYALLSALVFSVMYMSTLPAVELPAPEPTADCDGPYKGKRPTEKDMKKILATHRVWLDHIWGNTSDKGGRPADLCGANLSGPDLSPRSEFEWAELLKEAELLERADLGSANLQAANLYEANIEKAQLPNANLSKAHLVSANLYNAHLQGANFQVSGG
jgi:Pentapeptide repeats (8 copies)